MPAPTRTSNTPPRHGSRAWRSAKDTLAGSRDAGARRIGHLRGTPLYSAPPGALLCAAPSLGHPMLLGLTIRDVVLIDRLDLAFHAGLCVLTGETGAGKSILLDALGLALGMRAESGLVRHGAEQAVVTAEFALPRRHPARQLLDEA